ncbi:hypothetical protein E3A20_26590, partial [Planctomyces bekefii]
MFLIRAQSVAITGARILDAWVL